MADSPLTGRSLSSAELFHRRLPMSKADKRYLERHGEKWRVVVPVPRSLQTKVGTTKLKRSLNTDSLHVANSALGAVAGTSRAHCFDARALCIVLLDAEPRVRFGIQ